MTNPESARAAEVELKRRLDQLHLLLDIAKSIGSQLELRELIDVIGDCLREVIHCDAFWVSLIDAESEQLRVFALDPKFNKDALAAEGRLFPIEGSMAERVINSFQPLLVTRSDLENSSSPVVRSIAAQGIHSSCLAPLISRGRPIGVISMASLRENAFTQADADLLMLIAGQIAIAVQNSLNYERARKAEQEVKRKLERERLMLEINNVVVSKLDLQELLQVICSSIREAMGNEIVDVSLFDHETGQLRAFVTNFPPDHPLGKVGYEIPLEGGPSGLAFTSGQPVFLDKPDFERFPSDLSRQVFEQGYRSGGTIPLITQGRKLGVLGVISKQENFFSEEEKEFLVQLANQIAIAVDNSLNFERARKAERELAHKLDELKLLLDVTTSVTSHLSLRDLFKAISECLRTVIKWDGMAVSIHDPETGLLRLYALEPNYEMKAMVEEGDLIPIEGTPSGLAFSTLETVMVTLEYLRNSKSPLVKRIAADGVKSGCAAPLISHGRALGTLDIVSLREDAFTKEDAKLITQIAGQVAIAVENALNFERARAAEQQMARERERLALLLEINNKIASTLDLRELFKTISICIRSVLDYDFASLAFYDEESNRIRIFAIDRSERIQFGEEGVWVPLEDTPPGLAIRSRQAVLRERPSFAEFPSESYRRAIDEGIRSGCSVPIISRDRVIGVWNVASAREAAFTQGDADLLTEVGVQVAIALENALAYGEIEALKNKVTSEKLYLESEIRTEHNFEDLIGSSAVFKRILKQVETVAPTDSAVLIRGESGTGKELVARAIHNLSARRERTLVKINCAAIPTGLLESELFGHEKGAFTGAISQRIGRFELAHKGTLFLDEVGDIPLELQPKLLRVLQEQEFERLGSTRTQKVDVRLIAATNTNLEQMVADKRYRNDLYYRLNVFPVTIPPLRERREDIPALTRFFTQRYARRLKKRIEAIPAETMAALAGYHWPGNVRELEHFIERAVILTQGSDLEVSLSELRQPAASAATGNVSTLEAAEREHILRALEETNWVVGGPKGAASRLGMKRTTLQSKMQKLGLERASSQARS
ncbi:MAG TPA: sigma 54-interacting transcriptional regulator [Blastocatellia bacterium]|nr:sigma 54-interacting transcriptional regulator [Blastocatellia bacterium]